MLTSDIKKSNKTIVLFGAIDNIFSKYFCTGDFCVKKIIDNNDRLIDQTLNGVKIYPVESLEQENADNTVVIIMSRKHSKEMIKQVKQYNIKEYYIAEEDIEDFDDLSFLLEQSGIDVKNPSPTMVNIELSGICNLKCVYCPFHGVLAKKTQKGIMNWETLYKVVNQLKYIKTIKSLTVVGNGELFVNPEWFDMVNYILEELEIDTLQIYTNGMLLNNKEVDKLNNIKNVKRIDLEVSIDGRSPKECEKFRTGAVYDIIKKNLQYALPVFNEKIKVTIFNLYLADEEEIKKNGYLVEYSNQPPEFLLNDFPKLKIVSRKAVLDGDEEGEIAGFKKIKINKQPPYSICFNTINRMAIDYQGNLIRCSCSKGFSQRIGNVENDHLLELWRNDAELNLARRHLLQKSNDADFCSGCELKGKEPYYVLVEDKLNGRCDIENG